jgi:hypothetical protein
VENGRVQVLDVERLLHRGQADRPTKDQVAREGSCDPGTVGKWRKRFAAQCLDGRAARAAGVRVPPARVA